MLVYKEGGILGGFKVKNGYSQGRFFEPRRQGDREKHSELIL